MLIVWLIRSTCSWNLQSELKVTHENTPAALPAPRTSFSGTITSCRKTAVVLKLRKVFLQSSSLQPPKLNVDRPTWWLGYSLQKLLKIRHWTLKNSMTCGKKCFFIILATAISGMPTPEICFLPGQFRLTILPKDHHGESLSVCELDTQPSNWERTLYHWAIAAAAKSSSPMPRCQEMLWCAVGALLRNQRYKKKD